jgi:hypothetical protein
MQDARWSSWPVGVVAVAVALAVLPAPIAAQQRQQTTQDEYAVYDLLSPDTASFRTVYEVAVTTPGVTTFFDRIGSGLTFAPGRDDAVVDMMTGSPLKFDQAVDGLQIHLARPVPPGRPGAVCIIKTHGDAKSYHRDGDGRVRSWAGIRDTRRAAGRLSAHRVQRPVAGAPRAGRLHPDQLHASGPRVAAWS